MEERNYGIDCLRLILMFMVCLLHVLGQGGVLSASISGSINYKVFWFMEILAYSAVDSFAVISGYTAKDKSQKYEKIVNIWFQMFFYSFIVTFVFSIFGVRYKYRLLKTIFPISNNYFWYMTAYFGLFLIKPFLNKFLFSMEENKAKKFIIIIIILFSFVGLKNDSFHTKNGYSLIWLIVLYCFGVLSKKINLFSKKKTGKLILMWFLMIIVTFLFKVYLDDDILVKYTSPTVLLSGIIMVIIFSRFNINGKIISKLAPYALGIYLFQLNKIIWGLYINNAFGFIVNKNIFLGILLVILFAFIIFICGITIEYIRSKIAKILRISKLSERIVCLSIKVLDKLSIGLK